MVYIERLKSPRRSRDKFIDKLDEFLKISGRKLLDHAGKISAETARAKAELEYGKYHAFLDTQPRRIDAEFEKAVKQLPKPANSLRPNKRRKP